MSRQDPNNREEAYLYQFEDDCKLLRLASIRGEDEFEKILQKIELDIKMYRSVKLRKISKKAKDKTNETRKYMRENYPDRANDYPHIN